MKLPKASLLRFLIAKHWTDIIQFRQCAGAVQLVLDKRPHSTCRALRPQGNTAIAAIEKRVHLFRHDVCRLTDTALEQLCVFKDRCAYFAVVGLVQHIAHRTFKRLPNFHFARQEFDRAARTLNLHLSSSFSMLPLMSRGLAAGSKNALSSMPVDTGRDERALPRCHPA